jgi:hypothetical protein
MHKYHANPNANKGTPKYVDYHLYYMDTVEYNIACDTYNLTITITANGPDMSIGGATGLYDACDHQTVVFGSENSGAVVKMN